MFRRSFVRIDVISQRAIRSPVRRQSGRRNQQLTGGDSSVIHWNTFRAKQGTLNLREVILQSSDQNRVLKTTAADDNGQVRKQQGDMCRQSCDRIMEGGTE